VGGDEEAILSTKLKVKSWKDLTNEMQSKRQECHIETHFALDFNQEIINKQWTLSIHHEDQGIK
jgi:hypothetical protein